MSVQNTKAHGAVRMHPASKVAAWNMFTRHAAPTRMRLAVCGSV